MSIVEVFEKQNDVIRIQSEVIDDLFLTLMQHIEAGEADKLPVIDKISTVASIRAQLE